MPLLPTLSDPVSEKLRTRTLFSQFRSLSIMLHGLKCLNLLFLKILLFPPCLFSAYLPFFAFGHVNVV